VHLTAQAANGELWVLITDDGCGHQTPAARPGLGMGLSLIADACAHFTLLERAEGCTEARMTFALPAVRPDRAREPLAAASAPGAPIYSTVS
jgi:nitrate/nitrite-specific signal transduction histidine kinase